MKGFAFHCHHDVLVEYVTDYDERVECIKENKPEKERELRLRLFKIIPDGRIPSALLKAKEAHTRAEEACAKAGKAYGKALKAGKAYGKAGEAYIKAWEAYAKVGKAYIKAGKACYPELEKLHAELCPNCPFDGHTIFGG